MNNTALASMLAGVAMSFTLVVPALAQDATKTEVDAKIDSHLNAAVEVVQQTGNLPDFNDQFTLIVTNSKNWLIREKPDAEKDIIAAVDAAAELYKDQTDSIARAAAVAWARYLKEDELKEVLAFFKTPAGQKFANYQPRILGETIKSIQDFSGLMTQAIVQEAKKTLNAKGHKFQ
jgi:hypothetical protein